MNTIFEKSEFITTEFENYFTQGIAPWGKKRDDLYQHTDIIEWKGLPVFIKDFEIDNIDNPIIRFTALGCINIFINGKRADFGEMLPGWTNYNVRCLYHEKNIADYLNKGKNRILCVLSSGWYIGRISGGYYGDNNPSLMLEIFDDDKLILSSDTSWKCKVTGQIRTADIWDGEYRNYSYDGYESMSLPEYNISEWDNADIYNYKGVVTKYIGSEIKIRESLSIKPKSIVLYDGINYNGSDYGKINIKSNDSPLPIEISKGIKAVIDFNQETVGHVKLKFKAEEGTTLKIKYAEFLNDSGEKSRGNDGPEGSVYTINLRSALGKTIIKSGKNEVTEYIPLFTFYGYRFIEIEADNDVTIYDLTAEIVGNDNIETGTIETSDESVNKLISNALWGQRSNYLSVPTDCPQRDERLGWTGDAQAFSITAAYNANVYGFFLKWMQDMRDSQSESGGYGDVNPRVSYCDSEDACAWSDAGIIIPYNMYWIYGDKTIIEEHFDSMCRYMDGLVEKYGYSGAVPRYGDWLAYDWCDNKFISSAYFVHDCDMMIYMSKVIEKPEKASYFESMRESAIKYFKDNFTKDGVLTEKTQCNKIISLAFDLFDDDYNSTLTNELEEQIKENGDRLSCGFLGTYNLCPALSKNKKDKTAYNLLLQRQEPSWLYSIDQGATTIWERWNSYTKKDGFGDVGMNSFNHYAYGAIVGWMYQYMCGIEAAEPGFRKIKLQPRIDLRKDEEIPANENRMTYAKATFNSPVGKIFSYWNYENDFTYECTVPDNVDCELILPVLSNNIIIDGEKYNAEGDTINIKLKSGNHIITQ